MAIFSGKIIEAYYTDQQKSTIEVIYKDGEKAFSHYLKHDNSHPDFVDLIKEYDIEALTTTSINRLNKYRKQLKDTISDYQQKALQKVEDELKDVRDLFFDCMINFNAEDQKHLEILYTFKLKAFDNNKIKNSTNNKSEELKNELRSATTLSEALRIFNSF